MKTGYDPSPQQYTIKWQLPPDLNLLVSQVGLEDADSGHSILTHPHASVSDFLSWPVSVTYFPLI